MPATPQVTDTNDVTLSYVSLILEEGTESAIFVVRFPARAGQFLAANDDALVEALGRKSGTSDAFVNLFTDPIDLTPYDGQTVDFDIKASAGMVTFLQRVGLQIRITYNP